MPRQGAKHIKIGTGGKQQGREARRLFCFPPGQLFEVHGSKLQPHPFGDLGQTSIKCITHTMLFLGVGKDPLNGFFAFGVKVPILGGIPGVVSQLLIIFPDMAQDGFHAVFGTGAQLPCGALGTDLQVAAIFQVSVPVGGTVGQGLVVRADHAVIVFIINILPPLVPALHRHGTLVGSGQHPAIIEYFFADMGCFVGRIRHDGLDLREGLCHVIVNIIESYWYILTGIKLFKEERVW